MRSRETHSSGASEKDLPSPLPLAGCIGSVLQNRGLFATKRKDMSLGRLEGLQRRAAAMRKALQADPCGMRLREVSRDSPELEIAHSCSGLWL